MYQISVLTVWAIPLKNKKEKEKTKMNKINKYIYKFEQDIKQSSKAGRFPIVSCSHATLIPLVSQKRLPHLTEFTLKQ